MCNSTTETKVPVEVTSLSRCSHCRILNVLQIQYSLPTKKKNAENQTYLAGSSIKTKLDRRNLKKLEVVNIRNWSYFHLLVTSAILHFIIFLYSSEHTCERNFLKLTLNCIVNKPVMLCSCNLVPIIMLIITMSTLSVKKFDPVI